MRKITPNKFARNNEEKELLKDYPYYIEHVGSSLSKGRNTYNYPINYYRVYKQLEDSSFADFTPAVAATSGLRYSHARRAISVCGGGMDMSYWVENAVISLIRKEASSND